MYYRDLTRYKMVGDVLTDVCDVHIAPTILPRSCLLIATVVNSKSLAYTSKKDKHAMFV